MYRWETVHFLAVLDDVLSSNVNIISLFRDPVPFKPLHPGSEKDFFRIPDHQPKFLHIFESLETNFWVKSSKSTKTLWLKNFSVPVLFSFVALVWIRDPGWIKIRIRDKHPGSATLVYRYLHTRVGTECIMQY
jgi:hypothetical protein